MTFDTSGIGLFEYHVRLFLIEGVHEQRTSYILHKNNWVL